MKVYGLTMTFCGLKAHCARTHTYFKTEQRSIQAVSTHGRPSLLMMLNCIFSAQGCRKVRKSRRGGTLVHVRSFKGKGFAHMAVEICSFTPPCIFGSDGPAVLPLGNSGNFLHSKMSFHSSLYRVYHSEMDVTKC